MPTIIEMLSDGEIATDLQKHDWLPEFITFLNSLPDEDMVEVHRLTGSILAERLTGDGPSTIEAFFHAYHEIGQAMQEGIAEAFRLQYG